MAPQGGLSKHTGSDVGTALLNDARGSTTDQGVLVLADAGEVIGLAVGRRGNGIGDASLGALRDHGEVLGNGSAEEGDNDSGVLHFDG